jgi:acyl-CoA dehydrogenase
MTEPEVAGSDPTLIQTHAYQDGDEWVINGHKWFISGARGAKFAILIARTEDDPEAPGRQLGVPRRHRHPGGWEIVRDVETMSGSHNHCEIRITDMRVHKSKMLGGRGQGHLLGQARLGPARLAHCMRWIGQAETALEMMCDRALEPLLHGSLLAEKQGIQWKIADSTMELYQAKLMVLHAAYLIDKPSVVDFKSEVSMAKHHVANACGTSSTGPSRCTAPSATPPTPRSPACSPRPAGAASPTAPTRSTRCASPNGPSPTGRTTAPSPTRPASSPVGSTPWVAAA